MQDEQRIHQIVSEAICLIIYGARMTLLVIMKVEILVLTNGHIGFPDHGDCGA